MIAEHSPTPWASDGNCIVTSDNRFGIAILEPEPSQGFWCDEAKPVADPHEMKANAAFIVRAANSHDALIAALKEILPYAEAHVARVDSLSAGDLYPAIRQAALQRARAALALAQAE